MQLDHEQFQGAKELAEIGVKISASTAALQSLKIAEGEYISEREARLVARLKATLVDSAELIKQIGSNHDALVGYRNFVTDLHDKILSLIQCITDCEALLDEAASYLDQRISDHEAKVASFREAVTKERALIDGERDALAAWSDRLGERERDLNDREKTLKRTLDRIKAA